MERRYWLAIPATAIDAAKHFIQITPGTKRIRIVSLTLTVTDGDPEAPKNLILRFTRGYTTSGTVGTVAAPIPGVAGDQAPTFTAKTFTTVAASGGDQQDGPLMMLRDTEIFHYFFEPCENFEASADSGLLVLRADGTGYGLTVYGTLCVEEY